LLIPWRVDDVLDANDAPKYFAIIPAMFAAVLSGTGQVNHHALHSPQSASWPPSSSTP